MPSKKKNKKSYVRHYQNATVKSLKKAVKGEKLGLLDKLRIHSTASARGVAKIKLVDGSLIPKAKTDQELAKEMRKERISKHRDGDVVFKKFRW